MKYIAKPSLFNDRNNKTFSDKNSAIKYLEKTTGYSMDTNRETKISDWEIVDKLITIYQ